MKATPVVRNARPIARPADSGACPATISASFAAIPFGPLISVVPVVPHTKASPNRKMAELNEPSRKYLIAPSVE